jgi:hypothetical protein
MSAIGLQDSDLIKRGLSIRRDTVGVDFMRHTPFGEPGARYEEKGASRSVARGPQP